MFNQIYLCLFKKGFKRGLINAIPFSVKIYGSIQIYSTLHHMTYNSIKYNFFIWGVPLGGHLKIMLGLQRFHLLDF